MKIISVIIPVFNKDKYLDNCIKSIVNQTYTAWELILIDDGSYDKSRQICDYWEKRYTNIKVVHNENYGVSYSRNLGIKLSKGKYICFVDADDYCDHTMLEKMYNAISDDSCDMVMCGTKAKYSLNGTNSQINVFMKKNRYITREYLYYLMKNDEHWSFTGPCAKLYKSEIIHKNNLLFEENENIGEDFIFTVNALHYIDSIFYVDEGLYVYNIFVENSLSKKIESPDIVLNRYIKMYQSLEKVCNWYELKNEIKPFMERYKSIIIKTCVSIIFYQDNLTILKKKSSFLTIRDALISVKIIEDNNKYAISCFFQFCVKNKLFYTLLLCYFFKRKVGKR